ncbi:hypothetical protein LINGRAHAP2_LOCUS32861, partial [Linum grandiflorum]
MVASSYPPTLFLNALSLFLCFCSSPRPQHSTLYLYHSLTSPYHPSLLTLKSSQLLKQGCDVDEAVAGWDQDKELKGVQGGGGGSSD